MEKEGFWREVASLIREAEKNAVRRGYYRARADAVREAKKMLLLKHKEELDRRLPLWRSC